MTKGNLGRKGAIRHTFPHQSPSTRKSGRELQAGTVDQHCFQALLLLTCSVYLTIQLRTTYPEVASPISMGWSLPHEPLIKKKIHRLAYRKSGWRYFLN